MKSISEYFSKFRKLEHPDHKKELLIKIIALETGISLNKDQLDLRNKTLFIKADGYVKSEIYMKKEILLRKIEENFSDLRLSDIR